MFKKKRQTKRVVIAGCRDYTNYDEAKTYIDYCLSDIRKENDIIIISGCASGADAIGEHYAKENGFNIEKYPAFVFFQFFVSHPKLQLTLHS